MTETTPSVADLPLASEFPAASRADWQRMVQRVLHGATPAEDGADPASELATHMLDGITIEPLYTADDGVVAGGFPGQAPFVRGSVAAGQIHGWDVRQHHAHPDATVAAEQILEDLEGGVSSIWLGLGDGRTPLEALPTVLGGIYLDLAPVVLDAGRHAPAAAQAFLTHAHDRGIDPAALLGVLGIDPLGEFARSGVEAELGDVAAFARRCLDTSPGVRAVVVDALAYHDAGATDVEELGLSLATGVAYLRVMDEAAIAMADAVTQLEFRYAATSDQFATIAKLRAARRLWARITEQCGVDGPGAGQRQHAVTSWPMLTRRDPWNNILRGTLAAMAAGVGGAGAVTVLPFDAALGLPDELARRVARNTQALLVEESHVARVIDPAGGSWYVESLTDSLAHEAWTYFQSIEASGGIAATLRDGTVVARIAASREKRWSALAHARESITGVSEFPLLGESVLKRQQPAGTNADDSAEGGLGRVRWSTRHEVMRDRADAYQEATGRVPTVSLVAAGNPRGAGSRIDTVRGLLSPAGIATETVPLAEVRAAMVTVLCCADPNADGADGATDAADEIAAAVTSLRAAGVARVVVAAGTADVSGIDTDDVISAGMDVLAFQERTLQAVEEQR